MFHVPEKYRLSPKEHGILGSTERDGNNGAFRIKLADNRELWIIASDATDWDINQLGPIKWEHVSVHVFCNNKTYIPRWDEMCKVKELFWDDEDTVIQFHPKKSDYINNHPSVLHLWRPINCPIPTPHFLTVGIK